MSRWILVAEDEAALGEMLRDNLAMESYNVELVQTGPAAIARMQQGGIDLLVLDVMLPGCTGFEVLREMRGKGDKTPVLVLSARNAPDDRIKGLELQADDYLTKPFNLRELLLRVDALLRRQPTPEAGIEVLEFGGNRIDFRAMAIQTFDGRQEQLTPTETKMLKFLAMRKGAVVSRKEVVEHLFGGSVPTTIRTLDNVVLRLRKLLEPEPAKPRHLLTIRGLGFRFQEQPEG